MSAGEDLDLIVSRFIAGQPFWEFWDAFMRFHEVVDESVLPPEQQARLDELYELVYMSQPDPTTELERDVGLVGERELRERLRHFRVFGDGAPPV